MYFLVWEHLVAHMAVSKLSSIADCTKIWKQRLKSASIPFYWFYVLVFSTDKWHLESMLQKCISIKHISKINTEMLNSLQLVKFRTVGFSWEEFRRPRWNLTASTELCYLILVHKFCIFSFETGVARAQATIQCAVATNLEFAVGFVYGRRQRIKLKKQKG